jgi:hypothetical protein
MRENKARSKIYHNINIDKVKLIIKAVSRKK